MARLEAKSKYDPKSLFWKINRSAKRNPFLSMMTTEAREGLIHSLIDNMIEDGTVKPWEESEY